MARQCTARIRGEPRKNNNTSTTETTTVKFKFRTTTTQGEASQVYLFTAPTPEAACRLALQMARRKSSIRGEATILAEPFFDYMEFRYGITAQTMIVNI